MTLSDYFTQARHDRSARRTVRARREALTQELRHYRTSGERLELELLAARTPGQDSELMLDILSSMPVDAPSDHNTMLRSAWYPSSRV